MGILIGGLATLAAIGLILYVVGALHIRGKTRVPGSPETDRATGINRNSDNAKKENIR